MNKKKFHGEDFNSYPLVGLPTPTVDQTSAAANVQFVLDNAVDPALESRVTAIENKSSSIFTTFTDDFVNGDYVDGSTTATRENGYIRALFQNKYRDDFDNLDGIVQPNTSFFAQSGKLKRDTTASNTEHQFTTNAMTNFSGGVTQVSVTPSVSLSSTNTFASNVTTSTHTTASNIMPVKHIDVDGNEWTLRYSNAATQQGGAYLSASHIANGAETRAWPSGTNNATTVGDQPRNLSITSDNNYVYVAFYQTSLDIQVGMYNRTTGARVGTNITQTTSTSIGFRGQDLLVVGSKLYHLRTNNGASTANVALTVYNVGVGGLTQANVFTMYTDSSGALHTCKLAYDVATNTILWTAFKRASTNAVLYGRRSGIDGSVTGLESVTVATDSNGSGTAIFHNGVFRVIAGSNANTAFNYFTLTTGGTASSVTSSATSYSVSVYRFETVAFGNTLHVVYGNNAMNALMYSRFDITSGFTAIDTNQLYSFTQVRRVHIYGINTISQTFKVIAEEFDVNYDVFSYVAISETLQVEIRNSANNAVLASKTAYTSGPVSLTFSATNNFRVRFYVQFASLIPQVSSFEMDYFEIEATATNTPVNNPTTSDFVSIVIFDDRVVDTIFLSPIVANSANGSFAWSVSTDDGGTWQSVTTLNQFVSVSAGSKVRVKATITRNAGVTSLADMPRIESYQLSTKNVITPNDLLPLQVNMLKMGLKLNALGTYSTTEFVKMMIDLFENANNIDASSTAFPSGTGAYIVGGTSGVLVSKPETTSTNDGVTTVTSAIVMAEYTGTVSFYVRRGTGSWGNPIELGEIVSFSQGTPTDQIQIKAEMSPGAVLYGWAYLYQ